MSLFVFIFTFLSAAIVNNDFIPSVAVLIGNIAAFLLHKSSTDKEVVALIAGCGESKIRTMLLIYLLAGAFAVERNYYIFDECKIALIIVKILLCKRQRS